MSDIKSFPTVGPEDNLLYRVGKCKDCGVPLFDPKPVARDHCADPERCKELQRLVKINEEVYGAKR